MGEVVIMTTGGTIASLGTRKHGLLQPGVLTGQQLVEMAGWEAGTSPRVESVFQIPSSHMTFEKLVILKEKIQAVLMDKNVTGIVVTHGTDTLEETAYFLDLTIHDECPVVVTGSQRGPFDTGTDAFSNIRNAVKVAKSNQCRDMGVLVVFNEKIYGARYVKKNHTSNVDAFHASSYGCLGMMDDGYVHMYQKPIRREVYHIQGIPPKVVVIKTALGMDEDFIRCAVQCGAKGIILEGMGRGHVLPPAADAVAEAIKKGIYVVLTSSCEEGDVFPVYDFVGSVYDLKRRGVILGKDYNSKKARIRLAVILATGEKDVPGIFINGS